MYWVCSPVCMESAVKEPPTYVGFSVKPGMVFKARGVQRCVAVACLFKATLVILGGLTPKYYPGSTLLTSEIWLAWPIPV